LSILLLVWFSLAKDLKADIVRLKSGRLIEGILESGRADPIVIRTKNGLESFPASDVLDTKILLKAPLACLRRIDGSEQCGQPIARISKNAIDMLDVDTGEVHRISWAGLARISFAEPAMSELLLILETPLDVEAELENSSVQRGSLEKPGNGAIRTDKGVFPIPSALRRLTIRPAQGPSMRIGYLIPGYEQWRNGQRVPAFLLAGGSVMFAGIAAWSYADSERARRATTTGIIPLGGYLGTLSSGRTKRFRQSQTINHIALGGLASMFLFNAAHLQFATAPSSHSTGRVELGLTVRF
jgi:hypothetical protein